jgi:putative transposase
LETVVTAKRDKAAALNSLKRIVEKCGRPRIGVTDGLCSSRVDERDRQRRSPGGWSSPQQSGGKLASSFSTARTNYAAVPKHEELQKCSSIRAQVHNHFNQERHLVTRADYKERRSVALAEWRTVIA